jgi:coenzyme F420-reducing hydrogenase beta subunit
MEFITDKCTGCKACGQRCPVQAISFPQTEEGFLYFNIDQQVCIDCGLCRKICPQNSEKAFHKPITVWGARLKDSKTLFNSASGGAFVGIAQYILEIGGVVYGSAYEDDFNVKQIRVDKAEHLIKLQSSKYTSSDTADTYSSVKKDLHKGLTVLYSGTGCQIAGLRSFLGREYDRLFTIDVICHGVTSQVIFRKYINWLQQKVIKDKIIQYNFRSKVTGWGLDYTIKTKTKTKTKTISCNRDPYYFHFLKGDMYRECCYECKYARKKRISDFTIGDFWGIEKVNRKFYSSEGVSCILVNTPKAERLHQKISSKFYEFKTTFNDVAKENHNLILPTLRPSNRDLIYKMMAELSTDEFFGRYLMPKRTFKTFIKLLLPKWLLLIIKNKTK